VEAVRVVRFSGPSANVASVLKLAAKSGIDAREMDERAHADDAWVELAIPVAQTAGEDGDQLIRSLERSVARLGVQFRLREYLTEIRRRNGATTA
jgi:hypothetical protein